MGEWLAQDFEMDVHVQPNYDDFSCRWKFGKIPPPLFEDEAVMVPCFSKCPSKLKGKKDAMSQRREALIKRDEDRRLKMAISEITPDGTALSRDSLEERKETVLKSGKCWSVDDVNRPRLSNQFALDKNSNSF